MGIILRYIGREWKFSNVYIIYKSVYGLSWGDCILCYMKSEVIRGLWLEELKIFFEGWLMGWILLSIEEGMLDRR